MTPHRLLRLAIAPALSELAVTGIPNSIQARRFLLAIALQESGLMHRRQLTSSGLENGPASSFWQFEQGGGCVGVMRHPAVAARTRVLCANFNVEPTAGGLWEAIRYNDIVAAACARLLVYTLPGKLPELAMEGWVQYVEAWRPGKPHPEKWAANWSLATQIAEED